MSRLNSSTKRQCAAKSSRIYLTSGMQRQRPEKEANSHLERSPIVGRITFSQKRAIYRCGKSSTIISFTPKSGMERGEGWVQEQAQMRPAQAAAPPPPPQPAPHANAPTPFKTMFDGIANSTGRAMLRNNPKGNSHDAHLHAKEKDHGHQALECGAPAPVQGRATAPPKWKKAPGKPPEKSKFVCQAIKVLNPRQPTGEGTLAEEVPIMQDADSKEDDPMVSGAILPFKIEGTLTVTCTGVEKPIDIIIDTGSSWCLISPESVCSLGIEIKMLTTPIRFQQVDGSMIGGSPAMQVTEKVKLTIGEHWEIIWFIVIPKMTQSVIPGLAWLDNGTQI
ncbi:hypothetical protein E2320_020781 [Naja naja]|nr:hypothetical protein E2320_020781 [Naja naja]